MHSMQAEAHQIIPFYNFEHFELFRSGLGDIFSDIKKFTHSIL